MASKNLKLTIMIIAAVVILSVPSAIVILLGWSSAGMFAFLAAMAGLFGAMGLGWRGVFWVASVATISTGIAVLVSPNPIGSAILMMCVGLVAGLSNWRGLAIWSFMFPMVTAAAIGQPPNITGGTYLDSAIVAAICLVSILFAGALTMLIVKHGMQKETPKYSRKVNIVFTVNLTVLLALAGYIASYYKAEFLGMWFALTIMVIIRPYINESFVRGIQRAAGTILGFLIAIGVAYTFTTAVLYIAAGVVFLVIAILERMQLSAGKIPYWLYVSFITPGVVLLATTGSQVIHLAHDRLLATTGAAVVCLLVMGVERLIFWRGGLTSEGVATATVAAKTATKSAAAH